MLFCDLLPEGLQLYVCDYRYRGFIHRERERVLSYQVYLV